jgi:hypothetical protein
MEVGFAADLFDRAAEGCQFRQGTGSEVFRDPTIGEGALDDERGAALGQREAAQVERVEARRRLGQGGQQGRFRQAEILYGLVEIPA